MTYPPSHDDFLRAARLFEGQPHEDATAYERHARRFSRIVTAIALALVLVTFAIIPAWRVL